MAGAGDACKQLGGASVQVDGGIARGVVEPVAFRDKRLVFCWATAEQNNETEESFVLFFTFSNDRP